MEPTERLPLGTTPTQTIRDDEVVNTRFLLKEYAKSSVRAALRRYDLGLIRSPFDSQVVRAAKWLQVADVLDIGANIGQYASVLVASGFGGTVTSCEPLADAYAELAKRAARHSSWRAVNTAVGAQEGTTTINVSANSYSSSILAVNEVHIAADSTSRSIGTQTVPLTTVDGLLAKYGIDASAALLKIDTQGYEASVLDGASEALSRFAAVQLELSFVPLYAGQALFDTLNERMVSVGFRLFTIAPGLADTLTGRLLQADALYVASDRMPDKR